MKYTLYENIYQTYIIACSKYSCIYLLFDNTQHTVTGNANIKKINRRSILKS